jgi:hypothetical protein
MKKITIEEFVKRVNALQAGEHISVQLIENGYIVTAFATLVKGNRYHFMMVEGFYGNCEQGFEGFNEQGIHEYIDYVKMLADDTSELEEITELIVVNEKVTDKEKEELIQQIWDALVYFGEEGSWCVDGIKLPDGRKIEYVIIEPDGGVTCHAYDESGHCEYEDLSNLDIFLLKEILKAIP